MKQELIMKNTLQLKKITNFQLTKLKDLNSSQRDKEGQLWQKMSMLIEDFNKCKEKIDN